MDGFAACFVVSKESQNMVLFDQAMNAEAARGTAMSK